MFCHTVIKNLIKINVTLPIQSSGWSSTGCSGTLNYALTLATCDTCPVTSADVWVRMGSGTGMAFPAVQDVTNLPNDQYQPWDGTDTLPNVGGNYPDNSAYDGNYYGSAVNDGISQAAALIDGFVDFSHRPFLRRCDADGPSEAGEF